MTTSPVSKANPAQARMGSVTMMTRMLRQLFEIEREIVRTATTLIYRVGEPELKYLLCQHIWESAGHARFLRERGRELTGFGSGEDVRPVTRRILEETIASGDGMTGVAALYGAVKPALLRAYRHYLKVTEPLADWPSRKLIEEFILDEERHAVEIARWSNGGDAADWVTHLSQALGAEGGWLGEDARVALPAGFNWLSLEKPFAHPPVCSRGRYPICSSVFGLDPSEDPIVRPWLVDPKTDARVIRAMVYVWLMNEMDAVDYLATVFWDTPDAPFDLHYDLIRHLWDESRHSQFGWRQLPKLGIDLATVEHSLDLYCILVQMSPPERYAMMTMEFEAGSFPTKATVMDRVRELNDFEADTLLAFDRNDEQNHVRYGHRWLPEIMKLFGESRPVEEFVKATQARFVEMAGKFGGKVPHTLPAEKRLTGDKIKAMYGAAAKSLV